MSKVKCRMAALKTNGQVQCRLLLENACTKSSMLCATWQDTDISRNGLDHAIIWKEAAEENKKVWIPVWIIASSIFIS